MGCFVCYSTIGLMLHARCPEVEKLDELQLTLFFAYGLMCVRVPLAWLDMSTDIIRKLGCVVRFVWIPCAVL